MATNINKIIKTCKPFWPASEDFVNSATVFVNSATPRGRAPKVPQTVLFLRPFGSGKAERGAPKE